MVITENSWTIIDGAGASDDVVAGGWAALVHAELQNAASIAALVLTTETLVVEEVIEYAGSALAPGTVSA